jgi:hypothetical protein
MLADADAEFSRSIFQLMHSSKLKPSKVKALRLALEAPGTTASRGVGHRRTGADGRWNDRRNDKKNSLQNEWVGPESSDLLTLILSYKQDVKSRY